MMSMDDQKKQLISQFLIDLLAGNVNDLTNLPSEVEQYADSLRSDLAGINDLVSNSGYESAFRSYLGKTPPGSGFMGFLSTLLPSSQLTSLQINGSQLKFHNYLKFLDFIRGGDKPTDESKHLSSMMTDYFLSPHSPATLLGDPPASQAVSPPPLPSAQDQEPPGDPKLPKKSFLDKLVLGVSASFVAVGAAAMVGKAMIDWALDLTEETQAKNARYSSVSGGMNFATTLRQTYDELRKIKFGDALASEALALTVLEEERKKKWDPLYIEMERFWNNLSSNLEKSLGELADSISDTVSGLTNFAKKFNDAISLAEGVMEENLTVADYLRLASDRMDRGKPLLPAQDNAFGRLGVPDKDNDF